MLFISLLLAAGLVPHALRRRAAVTRKEMSLLIGGYTFVSALGIITTTSMLEQGSLELIILSATHCAAMAALPWFLVVNALVCIDVVEDGTRPSVLGSIGAAAVTFAATFYISLATALDTQAVFRFHDDHTATCLRSDGLFVLTFVWPAAAVVAYIATMAYVIIIRMVDGDKIRQLVYLTAAPLLFAAGQLVLFLGSQPLCISTDGRVNGAFLTAILNNGALLGLYAMWRFLTEDEWDDIRWSQTDMGPMPMTSFMLPGRF